MAKVVPIDGGKIRLPGPRDRMVNIGATGSGKTFAGLWHLSMSSFDVRPYVLVDPKLEEQLEGIDAQEIDLGFMPQTPGLYIIHPLPHQLPQLDAFFMDCWDRENIGLYFDEAYSCGDGPGLLACLTQGRSKRIPMIMNTQRPVDVSRFIFSESQYYQLFALSDKRDMKTVRNFAPIPDAPLQEHYSHYYDVRRRDMFTFKPVPHAKQSVARINARLADIWEQKNVRRF